MATIQNSDVRTLAQKRKSAEPPFHLGSTATVVEDMDVLFVNETNSAEQLIYANQCCRFPCGNVMVSPVKTERTAKHKDVPTSIAALRAQEAEKASSAATPSARPS